MGQNKHKQNSQSSPSSQSSQSSQSKWDMAEDTYFMSDFGSVYLRSLEDGWVATTSEAHVCFGGFNSKQAAEEFLKRVQQLDQEIQNTRSKCIKAMELAGKEMGQNIERY